MSTESKSKQQTRRSNPLEGSSLLSTTPVEPPPLPTMPAATAPVTPAPPRPEVQHTTETTGQSALLYTSRPSVEFRLRPFEQQHDRQTIYIDAYLAGALDALVQLVADGNKTRLVDEMVRNLLAKYERELRENEDLVRLTEEKYRKKHNL